MDNIQSRIRLITVLSLIVNIQIVLVIQYLKNQKVSKIIFSEPTGVHDGRQ